MTLPVSIGRTYQRNDGGTPSIVLGLPLDDDGKQDVFARHRGESKGYRVSLDVFVADHAVGAPTLPRGQEFIKRDLSDLETRWLNDILEMSARGQIRTVSFLQKSWASSEAVEAHDWPVLAVIVWVDEAGNICCGPVRWGHRNSRPGQCDSWSASPFPGAWSDVPRDRIIIVRHPSTF